MTVIAVFSLVAESSFAATVPLLETSQLLPLGTMNRMDAVGQNLEGKAQEAIGQITGDPKDQAAGKAKQGESQVRHASENLKDSVKVPGRAKAISKNLEGKTQEAAGNITGDPKQQASGKAKQGESQARNLVEDVKAKIQAIFN